MRWYERTAVFFALFGLAAVAFGVDAVARAVVIVLTVIFITYLLRHMGFAVSALQMAQHDIEDRWGLDFGYRPMVTVVVPGHNEAAVIEDTVRNLLRAEYPPDRIEFFVVNDGSTDGTDLILDLLDVEFPQLNVIHRPVGGSGGKSGALNDVLEIAKGEIFIVFDADHKPRADCILRLVRSFADDNVGLVQGRCIVRNAEETRLSRAIGVDYYSGYVVNEYGRQSLFEMPAYGGSNCAARASLLRAMGGFNEESVTEDTDLTVRAVLSGYSVRFDITAIDTEEAVVSFKRFYNQRYRWARGHQEVCRDYSRYVRTAPGLNRWQRFEMVMFLYLFHVPALSFIGLCLVGLRAVGLIDWGTGIDAAALTVLIFLGPLLEIGSALVITRAPRQAVLALLMFFPVFVVFSFVCLRAWADGFRGNSYSWVKTARSNDETMVAA